ncbi:AI-2E family transporter [Halocatena marina]|uniref:AI-2E family transporter n=1 Tax=Halocatena marina TaxID=2934937 RepID=A0ABD5YV40_9EURY
MTVLLGAILAYVILSYLGAFVLGVFIYYATRPIYEQFACRIQPPSVGVMVALLTISLPVLLLVAYTISIAVGQLGFVTDPGFSTYRPLLDPYFDLTGIHSFQEFISSIANDPQQLEGLVSEQTVQRFLESAGTYLGVVASGLLQAFIALAVAFYLLRDDHKLAGWARTALARDDETLIAYGYAVDQDLKTVFFGNILNAFVVAVTSLTMYHALNLWAPQSVSIPAPTLLGLLTGAASLIPVVGMKVVYVPVTVYLGAVAGLNNPSLLLFPLAFLIVSAVVIDGLTELILRPYISGRNLHVGLVLFAYILGPLIFGWYGLFLGPLLLVLTIHLARIVLPELIHGEPLNPDAIGADPIPDADGPPPAKSDDTDTDSDSDSNSGSNTNIDTGTGTAPAESEDTSESDAVTDTTGDRSTSHSAADESTPDSSSDGA